MAKINGRVTKGHDNDAAFDLHSAGNYFLDAGTREVIDTGVRIELEPHEVALVCSRSGLAAKHGIFVLNAPGVIDSGYKGDIQVILQHLGDDGLWIDEGDRIAQLLILEMPQVAQLAEVINVNSVRGANGLGSTGGSAA